MTAPDNVTAGLSSSVMNTGTSKQVLASAAEATKSAQVMKKFIVFMVSRNEKQSGCENKNMFPVHAIPLRAVVSADRASALRASRACCGARSSDGFIFNHRGTLLFQTSCKSISRHRTFVV